MGWVGADACGCIHHNWRLWVHPSQLQKAPKESTKAGSGKHAGEQSESVGGLKQTNRGMGSLRAANHPQNEKYRKRQIFTSILFYFILFYFINSYFLFSYLFTYDYMFIYLFPDKHIHLLYFIHSFFRQIAVGMGAIPQWRPRGRRRGARWRWWWWWARTSSPSTSGLPPPVDT